MVFSIFFSLRIKLRIIPTVIANAVVPILTTPKLHTAPETPKVSTLAIIVTFLLSAKSILLSLMVAQATASSAKHLPA